MQLRNFFLPFFIILVNITFAQKVSQNDIKTIADNFILNSEYSQLLYQIPKVEKIFSEGSDELLFYVLNYQSAYLVISADKEYSPVKAFSFSSNLNIAKQDSDIRMIDILKSDYDNFVSFLSENPDAGIENQQKWDNILSKKAPVKNTNDQTFGPYLASIYGQTWYYENGNPIYTTNYYTPNHNPVGCVALTFTEVMRYYEWPRKGVGSYSYSDNYGNTTGTYQANFEENYYNWSLVLDQYKGFLTTENQRSQLGTIAYHAAVSVNMEFESSGSTSNINRIPGAANNYFRYIADYKTKSASDFWQVLHTNLHLGIPAQFAIYTSGGAGHAIVGDGIKYIGEEKYYHLNMGWWGDDNGWYQVHQSFNAGGYTNVTAAVLNMIPMPELDETPIFNFEDKTVGLDWYYSNKLIPENYEMQIKRGVADWETYTDTLTQTKYIFQADDENDYSIRIRAKVNDTWTENSWSNIVSFGPDDFVIKGDEELTLYPTVADTEVKISYQYLAGSIIQVYNLQGTLVLENNEEIFFNEYTIDISGLQNGIYILKVSNDNEQIAKKFLKIQ